MNIITIAAIKGGTGKTTTAAAIAQAAAHSGRRVLCVDLDPQGNYSFTTGADTTAAGALEVLHGAAPASCIQHTAQGLDVLAAAPDLQEEQTKRGSANRLRDALHTIAAEYDYAIIDTPPQMGELVFNALQAAHLAIIPIGADALALQGLYYTLDIVRHFQQSNTDLKHLHTIVTQYDPRPKIAQKLYTMIAEEAQAEGAPIIGTIRKAAALQEAQAFQQSLYSYAPKSKPAQDYLKLFERIDNT